MKKVLTALLLFPVIWTCTKDEIFPSSYYDCRVPLEENNPAYPRAQYIEDLLQNIVHSGIPGIMLTVHDSANGYWSGAAGYADLASEAELRPCQVTRVGSTVKTFTAVTILKLQEEGKLNLDDPVSLYLPDKETEDLKNSGQSTIRQLLQHSSGIYNYIQNLKFQTASLNNLTKIWHPEELLDYARGQDPYFSPGSDVRYSNTNYVLLGMIIEKVTGKPYYEVFETTLFRPLGLSHTHCAAPDPVPEGIIRGYVDFYSKKNLINSTYYSGWDYYTADGGLISNAYDLNVFLTRLFNGQIISKTSMEEMLKWQNPKNDENEFETSFGLGIFRINTKFGPAYIHSGDAIGYCASMVYFPEPGVTITWAVNGNYGKLDELVQSRKAMEKIFETVLSVQ
ncbi:MAG TPA: serine hydrolase domain-containing protein [Bacteroidales bacterium]|nr:serine hydrolase domain-containing protein [Bacteroidales bacterium]